MSNATEARHPIRLVASRTGLTPATLRAWERRYGVVSPNRSEGGQRLYSDADIERLTRLRLLTDAGRSISMVAALPDEETKTLLEEDRASGPASATSSVPRGAARVVEEAFRSVQELDSEGLEAVLRRAAVTLGAMTFLEEVVVRLFYRVGEAWVEDGLGPAHEHMCTAVTERVMAWLTEPATPEVGAPMAVVGTLSGEHHGLGAMLASSAAALEGWHVTHLGTDLPAEDLAGAAAKLGARVLALSLVNADINRAARNLQMLAEKLPDNTTVLLGGSGAGNIDRSDVPPGFVVLGSLSDLRDSLRRLY